MEPDFLVIPDYNAINNAMYFQAGALNAFQAAEFNDKFGFYQDTFGVYRYMKMNSKQKFVLWYPEGSPLLWQPDTSCNWTPTNTLGMGNIEIEPTRVKLNEEKCYDEWMQPTFEAFIENTGTIIELSEAGVNALNALTTTLVKNATLGGRVSMVAGDLFDIETLDVDPSTPTRLEQAFRKTSQSVQGWIALAIATAAADTSKAHLNDNTLITAANISTDGKKYTGAGGKSVINLYDEQLENCPEKLQAAIEEGGVGGFGMDFYPLWLVSSSIHSGVSKEYRTQKASAVIEEDERRLRRVKYTYASPKGPRDIHVYMIDDTVVIPVREPSAYTQHITGTAHFCYLTLSGVIQLGGSFGELPVAGKSDVGIMIQQSTDAKDLGNFVFRAHALMAAAINDTGYISGSYLYATP